MNNLLNAAQAYEPTVSKTKNIAELGIVPLNVEIIDDSFPDKKTGQTKTQKVIIHNGVKYRVPSPVLEGIKSVLITAKAFGKDVSAVKITRSGTTQNDTRYKVEPVI